MTSDSSQKRAAMVLQPRAGRRPISASSLSKTGYLSPGQSLPFVIEPQVEGVLLEVWAENNRAFIEDSLLKYGGLLFRGFNLRTPGEFEKCVRGICSELLRYSERTTPRTQVTDGVYTSTEYPAHQSIAMHNEMSYALRWPKKLWFFCERPADTGGETPIVDVRKVFQRLSPAIQERFIERGWMLARNFGDGLGLQWQTSFNTTDRSEVEEYCRRSQISFEWRGQDHLRTSQVRRAVIRHPGTKELSWFNHIAFYHISSLDRELRESLLSQFKESELPFNTYYGDGSPIEDSVVEEIRQAYARETVQFPWQEGDVLLLDNMMVGHGRKPFSGVRKILVAMGDSTGRDEARV